MSTCTTSRLASWRCMLASSAEGWVRRSWPSRPVGIRCEQDAINSLIRPAMYYLMACQSPQPTTIGCRRKLLKRCAHWVPTWPGPGGASHCETELSESACRCAPCSGWKHAIWGSAWAFMRQHCGRWAGPTPCPIWPTPISHACSRGAQRHPDSLAANRSPEPRRPQQRHSAWLRPAQTFKPWLD